MMSRARPRGAAMRVQFSPGGAYARCGRPRALLAAAASHATQQGRGTREGACIGMDSVNGITVVTRRLPVKSRPGYRQLEAVRYCSPPRVAVIRSVLKPSQCMRPT